MRKHIYTSLLSLLFIIAISSCASKKSCCSSKGETMIKGKVVELTGNQMPSTNGKRKPPKGVKRVLEFYELTNTSQVTGKAGFYSEIKTKLVKKVESDENGNFQISLAPGSYSVFSVEEKGRYASTFDGNKNISPIKVGKETMENYVFKITYNAAF